jgi:7-keto-8-aminopelargonate synthetase-like enzyme
MRPETDGPPLILERLERELDELRERSLHRTLEDRGLDFCSNDYLGLATDPNRHTIKPSIAFTCVSFARDVTLNRLEAKIIPA